MRLLLSFDGRDYRNGWQNADPSRGNLDGLVEAGEASEVVVLDSLARFRPIEQAEMVRHWCSRLAPGGTICLTGTDLYEVARGLVAGFFGEAEAVSLLYGRPGESRATLYSSMTLPELLRSLGLEIVSSRVDGVSYVVLARRPQ